MGAKYLKYADSQVRCTFYDVLFIVIHAVLLTINVLIPPLLWFGYIYKERAVNIKNTYILYRRKYAHFKMIFVSLDALQLILDGSFSSILTGSRRKYHINLNLASVHWLPAGFRIDFKRFFFFLLTLKKKKLKYVCMCNSVFISV